MILIEKKQCIQHTLKLKIGKNFTAKFIFLTRGVGEAFFSSVGNSAHDNEAVYKLISIFSNFD